MNKNAKIEIIETQQESEVDDEIIYMLSIDGKTVSWAKTMLYSNLEDITTACLEKHKGYGRLLLTFIEKRAQSHRASLIRTRDFKASNGEATIFFENMLYEINPSTSQIKDSVNALKIFKSRH